MSRLSGLFSSVFSYKDWGETSEILFKIKRFHRKRTYECASGINTSVFGRSC